ncbi:MAG TPA: TonB-dependent receptor, partial [Cyclobacteriaceae bacterium]|nr:TonB-dependent receptor [Cyclobacteriaceae bacterium]
MKLIVSISLLVMLLPQTLLAQDNCSIAFSGKVIDAQTKETLPFATVYIQELQTGVVADDKGRFRKDNLCPGSYTFVCAFLGYTSITYKTDISKNTSYNFSLEPETTIIDEVVVKGEKDEDRALVSQSKVEIKNEDLIKVRGATLGEALTSVTGVYTLQSGPSIFKPVIHGLHSNRILVFNNGVRQEGQQWGSEHAPEIDPFIATKLSVIKGASSIRYGSDA